MDYSALIENLEEQEAEAWNTVRRANDLIDRAVNRRMPKAFIKQKREEANRVRWDHQKILERIMKTHTKRLEGKI